MLIFMSVSFELTDELGSSEKRGTCLRTCAMGFETGARATPVTGRAARARTGPAATGRAALSNREGQT